MQDKESVVITGHTNEMEAAASFASIGKSRHPLHEALRRVWFIPAGRFGLLISGLIVLAAVSAPLITPVGPQVQVRGAELQGPSRSHIFGTDHVGRDLYSRVIYGARTSLLAGVVAVSFGAFVGISSGLVAGYNGGWIDAVIMRFYDVLLTFPGILFAIAIVSVLGPSLFNIALAIGIGQMPVDARLTRSIVLSQREQEYITAARCVGASGLRMAVIHILPNTLPVLIVHLSLAIGFAVLAEGGLSFLGLGTQPPTPSWGGMINESRAYLRESPWYGVWPGVALALLLVGLNFLADGLREAMDPKASRGTGRIK